MKIALCGALGKMGKEVYEYCQNTKDIEVVLLVDKCFDGSISQGKTPQNQCVSSAKNHGDFQGKIANSTYPQNSIETVCNIADAGCDFDAIIDFSAHNATISLLKAAIVRRCAVVIATTGHTQEEKKYIEYASQFIPVFYSGNMSLGIAAMARCIKETLTVFNRSNTHCDDVRCEDSNNFTCLDAVNCDKSKRLDTSILYKIERNDADNLYKNEQLDAGGFYKSKEVCGDNLYKSKGLDVGNLDNTNRIDVEIIETHHVQKHDVPSGTALMLAAAVRDTIGGQIVVGRHENGKKQNGDIGIHSLRMGSVFGRHEVRINTGEELMTFTHEALSRKVYAKGAIEAVRYLKNQSAGLYGIEDLLRQ